MKPTTPRLLLIGGTDDDAGWVHRALASDNRAVRLERLRADEDPRPALTATRFDAILVDLLSSRRDAAGWLSVLDEVGQRVPIVVVADGRQESEVESWLATGASDWTFRPGLLGLSAVLARLQREAREEAAAEEKERQLREATAALVELARSPVFSGDDLTAMLQEITRRCTRSMNVDRCGVWLYAEDRQSLKLLDLFDASTGRHSHGTRLNRTEHPVYFETLGSSRVLASAFAQSDPRTREFALSYFAPEGITSTLDVALRLRSELVGALCIEHRGPPRRWTAAEEVFSSALADVVSLALETSERRRIEAALALSERRFRDIFVHSSDNILLYRVALDGRVFCEDINPAVERSTGYRRDDVVGREAHEVVPPVAASRLSERYQQAIRARVPITYEHELPLPSGARVYNTAIIPMLDDSGRVMRLASVARDVTAQRTAERLTRQLESQLAEAQKNEALARLATHVAHDVASLLSAVDAHAHQLLSGVEPSDGPRAILEATARGRELASRIASYGRRRPDERRPVELEPLVHEVLRQLSATAPGVEIVRKLTPVRVMGDAVQLHQVLLNLCANAFQSMPRSGTLTVTLERQVASFDFAAAHPPLRAGPCARLVVRDTGPGMDETTRRRIFEPYFSTSPERTGLGLAVVQSIVAGHDGSVFVTSSPGEGASFEVFLPSLDTATDQPGSGHHLMLVDDHPGMARVSAKLLETLGYRTTVYDDPRLALEAFRERPEAFDAVLTDLSMPQMSGEDFTRSLRAVRPTVPVVVSSGIATELDRAELARLGVAAVLMKPWRLDEAVATLKQVLPGR
ncbi:MAG: response regulator [Myxococcaceae bacterium]|nr:response regulator [Myxococcaceae bacterium]